jgi:hypothetical protein
LEAGPTLHISQSDVERWKAEVRKDILQKVFLNQLVCEHCNISAEHRIRYGGGSQIIPIPSDATEEEKEKMLRYWPSVLGMDIIGKFKLC